MSDDITLQPRTNTELLHAEEAILEQLEQLLGEVINIEIIDLIVIRTNKHNELRNSKPCKRCLEYMYKFQLETGIQINNIIYSSNNEILSMKYNDLYESPEQHIPRSMRDWYT